MDKITRLVDELWTIIVSDGGKSLDNVAKANWPSKRFGKMKKLLYRAIMKSSLSTLNSQIYFFTGEIYEPIDKNDFDNAIYQIVSFKAMLPDEDSVYDDRYKYHCYSVVMSKKLRVDNSIIVFGNCVLDVNGRKVHKFDKKWVQITRVDYDYVPNMRIYKWYDFLNSVLPDLALQKVLQMFLGAVFVNRWEQKIETMLILLGSGANGKSVIQETVRGVLGDENVSKSSLKELCHSGAVGDQTIMLINGKRLNYCSEIQLGEIDSNSDRLKAMISGEPVYGRRLYQDRCEARNIPLIMANANKMPTIQDKSFGMLRRITVIPFEVTIPKTRQNPHLAYELRDEYPGIMNWILEGRDMLERAGYKIPQVTDNEAVVTEGVAKFSAPITFMRMNGWLPKFENVELAPTRRIPVTELYKKYVKWCEANMKEQVSKIIFSRELVVGGYEKERGRDFVYFKVYSKSYIDKLRNSRFDDDGVLSAKAKLANPRGCTMTIDGVLWATSMSALAGIAGCGKGVVTSAKKRGLFDGLMAADKEKHLYNVRACIEKLREHHLIGSDEEKAKHREQLRILKYERYLFNQAMQYNNLPYRKYGIDEPQIAGYEVVDDTMTEMEAYEKAHEEYGFDMTNVKATPAKRGAYSKGGVGFLGDLNKKENGEKVVKESGEL